MIDKRRFDEDGYVVARALFEPDEATFLCCGRPANVPATSSASTRPRTTRCGAIRAPVLLLWGSEDRIVPLSVGERLAATIPAARLVVLERCGHVPQEEVADQSAADVRAFLSGAVITLSR